MWSAGDVDPERTLVAIKAITLHDGAREHRCPPLALEGGRRVEMLEVGLADDGSEASARHLTQDRQRIDGPALDEARPEKEIVHRRRRTASDQETRVLDEKGFTGRDLGRDDRGARRVPPCARQWHASRHDAE